MAPHAMDPERNPAITEYAGTSFRSRMKARWAAYFSQHTLLFRRIRACPVTTKRWPATPCTVVVTSFN